MKTRIEHLYVHVPFCTHICPYCAFFKHKNDMPSMKAFLPALQKEFDWACEAFDIKPRTIYFGGGTPTALSVSQLETLFSSWPWKGCEEFTFECNPATISPAKARLLKNAGVSRISLGVQAFDPAFLKLLGRTHNREQIRSTMEVLRNAGFKNINIDLMFALPGQTLGQWLDTLREAVSFRPDHISAYNLTFEEDTSFFEKLGAGLWEYDESEKRDFFLRGIDYLESEGFEHYEISNFARKGSSSIHNLAYWEGKDYLGFGPSACSTVGLERWQNIPETLAYAASIQDKGRPLFELERLTERNKLVERIFLGLRSRTGARKEDVSPWQGDVDKLIEEKLAFFNQNRLILTRQGMVVADMISEIFV